VSEPSAVVDPDDLRAARRPAWQESLPIYAVITVVVTLFVWWGARGPFAGYGGVLHTDYAGSAIFGGWFRFDGNWYELIATQGYWFNGPTVQSPVAFFPGYPMVLRGLHVLGIPVELAATLVTIAAGAGVSIAILRWMRDRLDPRTARIALITFLLYPYAFFLMGASYGDALFLVAAIGAFLLLEGDHPIWAGVAGAVATATRPVGIAVVVGLIAVTLWRRAAVTRRGRRPSIDWRRLRRADAGVLLSIGGIVGYMIFLGVRFGHPLAFDEVQQSPGWDQGTGPRTWFKITWFQQIKNLPGWFGDWLHHGDAATFEKVQYAVTVILQGLFVLGFLALAVMVWRRFGWGYGLYCFAMLVIALVGTKDFQGTGRYLLATFPCFGVLAVVLSQHRALRWTWWIMSAAMLLLWSFAFGRGYYVA